MVIYFKTCEICGQAINKGRLEALPLTRLCIDCAKTFGSDIKDSNTKVGMDQDTYCDLLGAVRS
ncbi:TraR/DksA family transcriptional regulator [Selenihalanaerobacter shriftii]|uniref:DksA/traR C4-type zinc finger n=1 Tax=Selenihalanaerobacter shriftii TaxID=142842 RepID=A0A1T4MY44_9FIRM|nr:TraR/DksA C4-type zinc finger protein [Selenihalanaerobacter shriftii]SJZ71821.1 dksA/traR C4-type zinc finger [Selenihalanaerobacter shriftii]